MGEDLEHKKILTGEAHRMIANALHHGVYDRKPDAPEPCEPPYMPPSEDKEDYLVVHNPFTDATLVLTVPPPVVLSL